MVFGPIGGMIFSEVLMKLLALAVVLFLAACSACPKAKTTCPDPMKVPDQLLTHPLTGKKYCFSYYPHFGLDGKRYNMQVRVDCPKWFHIVKRKRR